MIRQKANEMGYLPNMAARALKTKMTHNIGVLFIDDYHSGLTHPYFAPVLESLKTEVENLGYDITVSIVAYLSLITKSDGLNCNPLGANSLLNFIMQSPSQN